MISEFELLFEWEDPGKAQTPELCATWAALTIRAGQHVITELLDQRERERRDRVFLPLYPLAEWLVVHVVVSLP